MQSSRAKDHASSVICAATHCHPLLIACSRRKTGREILDEQQRLWLVPRHCNCSTACRYRYPRCWVWDQHRGALRICAHRIQYMCYCTAQSWGVPICKVVLLIQSCLGMAWVAHGMGCTRAELHVGQVQGRSVAASQACKVGAREWAASATIEPRVGCLYPMPGLLGLLGLLAVACWPARPRAARCVFRSWSVANPEN